MYTNIREITREDLQKKHTKIHYFGLGFIQVKLGKTYRLHFYTDKLPPIVGKEGVHNHRYDFTSLILLGSLTQELFIQTTGSTHILEDESCQEGFVPDTRPLVTGIKKIGEQHFREQSSYSIDHNTLHRVFAKECITLLKRSPYRKKLAQVARQKNAPKICPFSKKIEEGELWNIVDEMLTRAKCV